jgi:glycine/sarcosine N-methyltransferase
MGSRRFYARLARLYDDLFPEEPAITAFLAAGLPPAGRVLDLACGTGTYAAALARRGFAVTGLDLSADLIARGRGRAPGASLLVGDMRRFRGVAPGPYDRICCIGNSLPHLRREAEVAALLRDAAAALAPGGSLVVQTVNFDRGPLLAGLPALRAGTVTFERSYRWRRGRILFVATLTEPGAPPRSASVRLLPLPSGRLAALALAAGFARVELAGGFDRAPHAAESFLTILTASLSPRGRLDARRDRVVESRAWKT